jgi:hypothetical protein
VEQGFHYPEIGVADPAPLQIDVKLTGYRAKRLQHNEPDMTSGCLGVQPLLPSF